MPNVTEKLKLKDEMVATRRTADGTVEIYLTAKGKKDWEKRKKAYIEKMQPNCPEGYRICFPGQSIDMLGATELWRVHEHHAEPHMTRIPQDLIDDGNGSPCAARVPKEWGMCIYYRVI